MAPNLKRKCINLFKDLFPNVHNSYSTLYRFIIEICTFKLTQDI